MAPLIHYQIALNKLDGHEGSGSTAVVDSPYAFYVQLLRYQTGRRYARVLSRARSRLQRTSITHMIGGRAEEFSEQRDSAGGSVVEGSTKSVLSYQEKLLVARRCRVIRLTSRSSFARDKWHSQTTRTDHPYLRFLQSSLRSRNALLRIFGPQYPDLDFGICPSLQVWPCQKQPRTWIKVRYLGNTMSGVPAKLESCNLNLKPSRCRALRRVSSGRVCLPAIARMTAERFSTVKTSAITYPDNVELQGPSAMPYVGLRLRSLDESEPICSP